jgi:hypothetical protein
MAKINVGASPKANKIKHSLPRSNKLRTCASPKATSQIEVFASPKATN